MDADDTTVDQEGAAQLLGVDGSPMTETEHLTEEAAKSSRRGRRR